MKPAKVVDIVTGYTSKRSKKYYDQLVLGAVGGRFENLAFNWDTL